MQIECIEYFTPEGSLIKRLINGVEQELTELEMEMIPFTFDRVTTTREEFEKLFAVTKKKRK